MLSGLQKDGTQLPVNISMSHIDTGDVLLVVTAERDVTKQKRAVKTAQQTAAVVEYSNDAIVGSTPEGVVTTWNPAAERLYGYSSAEILGKSGTILTPEDRAGEFFANLATVKDGKTVERLETLRRRKDGTLVPVSVTVAAIRDEDAAIVGASAVHRDVTEQRRAYELGQRMAAIVEGSDDAIIGRTLEGTITSWNPGAERMFGYSGSEIIGQSNDVFVPEDRLAELAAVVARIKAGQSVQHVETTRLRKGGTVFPASLTYSRIRDQDAVIVGVSVICRDITEQEHAARYARSLIEAALDPLITISPDGKIDDVNEATIQICGVPREELIGSDFAQYLTEPAKALEFFEQVFENGSATDVPLTVRRRDGTLTDVVCNASVYRDIGGNVLGVFAAGHDVSRQKQASQVAQGTAAIVRYSHDAIIGSTLQGLITSWNPAAERLFGYPRDEVIGTSVSLLSREDQAGDLLSILARVRAGEAVQEGATACVRKDGTSVPVLLTVAPIRDAAGSVIGVYAMAHDTGQGPSPGTSPSAPV